MSKLVAQAMQSTSAMQSTPKKSSQRPNRENGTRDAISLLPPHDCNSTQEKAEVEKRLAVSVLSKMNGKKPCRNQDFSFVPILGCSHEHKAVTMELKGRLKCRKQCRFKISPQRDNFWRLGILLWRWKISKFLICDKPTQINFSRKSLLINWIAADLKSNKRKFLPEGILAVAQLSLCKVQNLQSKPSLGVTKSLLTADLKSNKRKFLPEGSLAAAQLPPCTKSRKFKAKPKSLRKRSCFDNLHKGQRNPIGEWKENCWFDLAMGALVLSSPLSVQATKA